MHLIIGGADQGKTAYAASVHALSEAEFFTCAGTEIPADVRALRHLERFARACTECGRDAVGAWEALGLSPEVVICDDVSCGVVPTDPTERRWREETGTLLRCLADNAVRVTRVFCGLPLELKP